MKTIRWAIIGVFGFVAMIFASQVFSAQEYVSAKTESETACKQVNPLAPPEGFVLIDRKQKAALDAMPLDLLADARREFRENHTSRAASDIYFAAQLMKIQHEGTSEKSVLDKTAKELEQLSRDVERNEVKSNSVLDEKLTHAGRDFAEHQYLNAIEAFARHMTRNAASDFSAAENAVERSIEWSGNEIAEGDSITVDATKKLARKLAAGGAWTEDELKKGLASLGTEIERIDSKLKGEEKKEKK